MRAAVESGTARAPPQTQPKSEVLSFEPHRSLVGGAKLQGRSVTWVVGGGGDLVGSFHESILEPFSGALTMKGFKAQHYAT